MSNGLFLRSVRLASKSRQGRATGRRVLHQCLALFTTPARPACASC